MTDHLPKTYRGVESAPTTPVTWTNLPPGVTVETVDHAADLEAALAERVHDAALCINIAARDSVNVTALVRAVELNLADMSTAPEHLRLLIGYLAVALRRAHHD
jgi:hypothetical protein